MWTFAALFFIKVYFLFRLVWTISGLVWSRVPLSLKLIGFHVFFAAPSQTKKTVANWLKMYRLGLIWFIRSLQKTFPSLSGVSFWKGKKLDLPTHQIDFDSYATVHSVQLQSHKVPKTLKVFLHSLVYLALIRITRRCFVTIDLSASCPFTPICPHILWSAFL